MIVFLDRPSRTRVSCVAKAVEAMAVISTFSVLTADQLAVTEAVINLDIKLVLGIPVGS